MIKAGVVLCHVCDGPAFVAKEDIHSGDPVVSYLVEHVDGSMILDGSVMKCDTCGSRLCPYKTFQRNITR